jgi:hypothetical protein
MALRYLLAGAAAGWLVAAGREPPGLDAVRLAGGDAASAALFAAVPWILLAGLLGRTGSLSMAQLLSGAALGVAFHAFVLDGLWRAQTRFGTALDLLLPAAVLFASLRGRPAAAAEAPEARASLREALGLCAAGAGLALAWAPLGFHLRHLGLGSEAEASTRGVVLAALLVLGALAFGPLVARGPRGRALALGAGLPLAAAAALLSAALLADLADPARLELYLKRFGQDYSRIGMLGPTLLLGAAVCVVPGLCAGAALAGLGERVRLAALCAGIALGRGLWPIAVGLLREPPRAFAELYAGEGLPWTARQIALGIWVASLGGALVALGLRGRVRVAALALVALAALAPCAARRRAIWILSPWHRIPIEPELAWNTESGLFTVEPERGGALVLTLDRRRLTPLAEEEEADTLALQQALALLPPEKRVGARLLYVGQLTPARAFALARERDLSVEHSVPWHAFRAALDAALFGGDEPPENAIAPAEARRRIAAGSYDLVFAAPTFGALIRPRSASAIPFAPAPARSSAGVRVPAETLAVVWLSARSQASAATALGPRALPLSRGVYDLALGVVAGGPDASPPADAAPCSLATGSPRRASWPLAYLRMRPEVRDADEAAALFERLAEANDGPHGELALALARLSALQQPSSPFETLAEQTEIDAETLAHLERASELPLDRFLRALWEGVAALVGAKRLPDLTLRYLVPLAEEHAPWPALERAIARAYQEFTMPAEAADWLARAVRGSPHDITLALEAAEWTGRAGDAAGELALLRQADALQPGREDVARRITLALLRAGDPEGRRRAEALFAEHPEDEELAELLRAH